MKKKVKRILPILLILLIIASMIWYLFIYDRDFTRDMLLQTARFFEGRGDRSTAAWFYDRAYDQSGGDDAVAIELAEHFKESGNYTQAEVTLSRAIAEGGSAQLYVALSRTYVEQDKLLDAVNMLDNITDEAIRRQIAEMRPAAPTADTPPNYYNQYITVTVLSDGGSLYLTTDGTYPTTTDGISDGVITLAGGENTVYAITVSDEGLVSPLAILGYTIIDVIEEVTFTDPAIDAAVRSALGFDSAAAIYSSDLWTLTELTLPEGAGSYLELSHLPHLQKLTIQGGSAETLDGINSLTSLQELTVRDADLRTADLLIAAALPNLQSLTLSGCGLSSIDNLSTAARLTYLDLSDNSIRDFTALSFMADLTYLDLSHNALTSLNAASALTGLQTLKVSGNSLTSIVPISGCTALKELDISTNAIASLSGAESLTALEVLNASYNDLPNVLPLETLTGLRTLDVSNNSLADISCLSSLTALEFFYFSYNQVTALPEWEPSCALVHIDGSYNRISQIGTLANYENLNYVLMESNEITNVDSLATCPNLIKVNVYNNPVDDVSALLNPDGLGEGESTSVTVIWNPLG